MKIGGVTFSMVTGFSSVKQNNLSITNVSLFVHAQVGLGVCGGCCRCRLPSGALRWLAKGGLAQQHALNVSGLWRIFLQVTAWSVAQIEK